MRVKNIFLFFLIPLLSFGQASDNTMIATNIGLDLAYIKRELSMPCLLYTSDAADD